MQKKKINILELTQQQIVEKLNNLHLPKYIASQIYNWIYQKYVTDFSLMTNISKQNQEILEKTFITNNIKSYTTFTSQKDETKKYLVTLIDNLQIEMVVIPGKNYQTLCISSQCGCPLKCKFCLTGKLGLKRNLSTAEIISEVILVKKENQKINHIVFMGMGEPFLNFENVINSLNIITDKQGLDFSKRKVTISTVGVQESIQKLIDEKIYLNLALSIGHVNSEKRIQIMPIEKHSPLFEITKLLKKYLSLHNRKLTLEYTLLEKFNDSKYDLEGLINIAKFLNAKINLINLNPHEEIPFKPVTNDKLKEIKFYIEKKYKNVTIRISKGQDISAACGQLTN